MTGLIMAAQLIMGLAILVTLHELGHYLAARAFGIRVEKFYLFFDAWGVKLFKFKKGDTEYGIGWLPLGGYVKIAGMIDESMDKDAMAKPAEPWEFRSKPAWQRLIVMLAGVTMNVILGIAIYTYTLSNYTGQYLPVAEVTDGIYAYDLGREAGLKTGDKITAIDGKNFERFEDLLSTRVLFGANLSVERDAQNIEVLIPEDLYRTVMRAGRGRFIGPDNLAVKVDSLNPDDAADKAGLMAGDIVYSVADTQVTALGELRERLALHAGKNIDIAVLRGSDTVATKIDVTEDGTIGIYTAKKYDLKPYTFGKALKYGTSDAFEALIANAKGLGKIFSGEEKASDSVQGPIGIARIYGGVWDWQRFWVITGLLSMILAFMNILPIPALDGGHVIFLTIETITRKKFSDKFMERAQVVGMIMLLGIMAFAIGNDVWKHIIN